MTETHIANLRLAMIDVFEVLLDSTEFERDILIAAMLKLLRGEPVSLPVAMPSAEPGGGTDPESGNSRAH